MLSITMTAKMSNTINVFLFFTEIECIVSFLLRGKDNVSVCESITHVHYT